METRANYVLIGGFVVVFVIALFGFVVWLAKVEFDRTFAYYDIYFEGSVSGLSKASQVRFNGIPVGSVIDMAIDPDNFNRVRVTVELAATTPVREDSVARLELQGITGVSLVQISGGSNLSPPLTAREGQRNPVIASAPSKIEELVQGAPDLINKGVVLVSRAADLLNDGNRQAVGDILANAALLVERLAGRLDAIDRVISAADSSARDVAAAAAGINELTARLAGLADDAGETLAVARGTLSGVDATVDGELRAAIADFRRAAASVAVMGDGISATVAENRENIAAFTGDGLNGFARFVTEARLLVASISRITTRIEDDPARFLLGRDNSEYRPEPR